MDFNLANLSNERQDTFWLPLYGPSLRHNLVRIGLSCPFRLHHSKAVAYRGRLSSSIESSQCKSLESGKTAVLISVRAVRSGWIDCSLQNGHLYPWLEYCWQTLSTPPLPVLDKIVFAAMGGDFPIQYAHARCCSAIRRASCIPSLQAILKGQSPFSATCIDLMLDPYRRSLIQQWAEVMDALDGVSPAKQRAISRQLGFAALNSIRRMSHSASHDDPPQGSIDLGLVILIRQQLQIAIEREGVIAPTDL